MLISKNTFDFKSLEFHYYQFGTGRKVFFAFHGFGQSGILFKSMAEAMGEEITMYSFDLPFHGKSYWKTGESPLEKAFWKEIIEHFLEEKSIKRFSIMGFSLGGKFALATLESFPDKVEQAILIAPDGIKTNFWYGLATYPLVLRKYFKSIITRPSSFFKMIAAMNKLRLMDKGILRFAEGQMSTIKNRRKVYYSWVVFRKISFDLKALAKTINQHKIPIIIYIGTFDKIITASNLRNFLKLLDNYKLKALNTGHNSLLQKVVNIYKNE